MAKYSHAFDIAFEIETDKEAHEVSDIELLSALLGRIQTLISEPHGSIQEAVGCYDTSEVE